MIGLTDEECEKILFEFNNSVNGIIGILDYYKGKPMKLNFEKKMNGRILAESDKYDARNGKFRFFEALLETFLMEEILITKKGYRRYVLSELPQYLIRQKEKENIFKQVLNNLIPKENEFGKYWAIDEKSCNYKPKYLR